MISTLTVLVFANFFTHAFLFRTDLVLPLHGLLNQTNQTIFNITGKANLKLSFGLI
jgi:uncharacterized membrane protein YoaT (DUF817 family)